MVSPNAFHKQRAGFAVTVTFKFVGLIFLVRFSKYGATVSLTK